MRLWHPTDSMSELDQINNRLIWRRAVNRVLLLLFLKGGPNASPNDFGAARGTRTVVIQHQAVLP